MSAARDEYNELFRDKSHRTQHPEDDNDDSASFLEDDSDTENNDPATPTAKNFSDSQSFATTATAKNAPRYQIPTRRHQSNTGPKGVITDAQDYANAAREYRTSVSANRPSLQQSRSNSGNSAPQIPASVLETGEDDGFGGLGETNGNDDEHDQDFMEQWRQNRLKELQGSGAAKLIGLSGREKRAKASRFGGLVPVDGDGFLEAVDGSGSVTVVVVFIYDDKVRLTDLMSLICRQLYMLTPPCSPKSRKWSRIAWSLWRGSTSIPASSSYTIRTPRWNLPASLPCWPTEEATSLPDSSL